MKLVLYTTHCPKCNVLTTKLNAANIKYDICEDIEIMESKGIISAPMLEVDDKMLDFGQAIKWVGEQNASQN